MRITEHSGGFSGYNINNSKSVLMFFNKEERHNPTVYTPFMTATDGFRYLGVKITPELSEMIPVNQDPLVNE